MPSVLGVGSPSACTHPLVRDILNMIHAVACRISFVLHCPCPEVSFSYSPPLLSLVFFLHRYTCNFQRDGCLFIPFVWWLMAGLHHCAIHEGVIQSWGRLPKVEGIQPPFSDALINHWLSETHCENSRFKIQVMHILIQS